MKRAIADWLRASVMGALGNALWAALVAVAGVTGLVAHFASGHPAWPAFAAPILVGFCVAAFVLLALFVGSRWGVQKEQSRHLTSLPPHFDVTLARHNDVIQTPNHAVVVTVGQRGRTVQAHWVAKDTLAFKLLVVLVNRWSIEFRIDRVIGSVNYNSTWDLDDLPPYMKKDPLLPQTELGLSFDYTWRLSDPQLEVLKPRSETPVLTVLDVTPHAYLSLDGREFQVDGGSQVELWVHPNSYMDPPPNESSAFPRFSVARGNDRTRRGLFH